jgi:hypothetical protein
MKPRALAIAFLLGVSLTGGQSSAARAGVTTDAVDCWIENFTPSVQMGAWASYTVHMSGGLGTYSVTLSYGDGRQDSGTYTASSASFSHLFGTTGTFPQSGRVAGAGSEAFCGTSTTVY